MLYWEGGIVLVLVSEVEKKAWVRRYLESGKGTLLAWWDEHGNEVPVSRSTFYRWVRRYSGQPKALTVEEATADLPDGVRETVTEAIQQVPDVLPEPADKVPPGGDSHEPAENISGKQGVTVHYPTLGIIAAMFLALLFVKGGKRNERRRGASEHGREQAANGRREAVVFGRIGEFIG